MKSRALVVGLFAAFVMATGTVRAADSKWEDDFEKAKETAAELGRPILIDFTGSNWCGWCVKLDREVFSQSEFKKYAKKELVLFVADFPRGKKQDNDTKEQNKKLMETYGVRGFPTIVLVGPEGDEIARTGYKEGGAEAYVEHLKELLKDYEAPKPTKKSGDKRKRGSRSRRKSRDNDED